LHGRAIAFEILSTINPRKYLPAGAEAPHFSTHFGTTEQVAEKGMFRDEMLGEHPAGVKTRIDSIAFFGTTKSRALTQSPLWIEFFRSL